MADSPSGQAEHLEQGLAIRGGGRGNWSHVKCPGVLTGLGLGMEGQGGLIDA